MRFRCFLALLCFFMPAAAWGQAIKFCYMGSSSFPSQLAETTVRIAESTGAYQVTKDKLGGYFRLDYFARDPARYEDWLETYMPQIEAGQYDFAIMQIFNLHSLSPEQQAYLFDDVLPDLVQRIRATGAEVILYQKYADGQGCYPDNEYSYNLFHIEAAAKANVPKLTFTGNSMDELRDIEYFQNLKIFFDGGGHPGAMVNYVSACAMSYLLTGIDPRGNSVRRVPIPNFTLAEWEKLPVDDPLKSRVVDGELLLTDWEAAFLQDMAMRLHEEWAGRLADNITDPLVFANTLDEIFLTRQEYGNFYDWGLPAWAVEKLEETCAQSYTETLSTEEIDDIRKSVKQFSPRFEEAVAEYLTPAEIAELQNDYEAYWLNNNAKLRDDVYFFSLVKLALAEKAGDAAEIARLKAQSEMLREILSQAAENFLLAHLSEDERLAYLSSYTPADLISQFSPSYSQMQLAVVDNWQQLLFMREVYFSVWEDPTLGDELKLNYEQDVWLAVDSLFVEKWNEIAEQNSAGTYVLIVRNGNGDGYYKSGETVAVSAWKPAAGRKFGRWTGHNASPVDAGSPVTTVTIAGSNVMLVADNDPAARFDIANSSFEEPDVATYQTNPSGTAWDFVLAGGDRSGIVDETSDSYSGGVMAAPDGEQYAYIKNLGWISRDIEMPAGTYVMAFAAAQSMPGWYHNTEQSVAVQVADTTVATITPVANFKFGTFGTKPFWADGATEFKFSGLMPNLGSSTALIDDVKIYACEPVDGESPAAPPNVTASEISNDSFIVSWSVAPDNVGTAQYEVYRDDVLIGRTYTLTYAVTGLAASTAYEMKVIAVDASGNKSEPVVVQVSTADLSDNLEKTVLGLKCVAGLSPCLSSQADVDGDGRSGLAEPISALRKEVGLE